MKDIGWISEIPWDTVVVGSGIGGTVAALVRANQGKKVLVIEKGRDEFDHESNHESRESTRLPTWKEKILDLNSGKKFTPFLGEGVGGSSRLYGMVMERLEQEDFKAAGGAWPGSVSEWSPFFQEAEKMFEAKPAPEEKNFSSLLNLLKSNGIEAHSLKLAYHQHRDCEYCQSSICQKSCKLDAWIGLLEPAIRAGKVTLLKETEVLQLIHLNGKVIEVRCLISLKGGKFEEIAIRSENFVLAAGALRTPGLLRRARNLGVLSNFSELKASGHYLMRHFVDLYSLVLPGWSGLSPSEQLHLARVKAWGTESIVGPDGQRLGILQSFGRLPVFEKIWSELLEVSPALRWLPASRRIVEAITSRLFHRPLAASIVEDEPFESNFVCEGKDGGLEINYLTSPQDQRKIEQMRQILSSILGKNIARVFKEAHNNRRLAHACGTCRMGQDHELSVTDYFGKVHKSENLWIADSSVFPSSSDKNPSLTIVAHSLRMIHHWEHHLG